MFASQKPSASRTPFAARAVAAAVALAILTCVLPGAPAAAAPAAASAGATPAAGETESQAGLLTLTTERAVVFKDGYALVIKKATGTADADGRVFTLEVPDAAVLGSFWAVGRDQAILAMRAEYTDDWKRVDTPVGAATDTLDNLLKRITGKAAALTTAAGETVRGKVLGQTAAEGRLFLLIEPTGATGAGARPITIALSDIVAVRSPDLTEAAKPNPAFARAKRLSFDLGPKAAGKAAALTVMYFAPGIRWIPTYRVSGELKDMAAMALQAEILNQNEDLDGVALDLVVGVPHFQFREVVSPLVLEGALRNTLAQAAPQIMGQMSNAMFTQRSGEWRREGPAPAAPAAPADIQLPPELAAASEQDLYVYTVPNFSLRAGGRATVPLWQAQAPLHHLYTLDLDVVRSAQHGNMVQSEADRLSSRAGGGNARYPAGSPLRLLRTQVWHQLELTNTSKVPWTTGAAIILRGHLPMGQDLLTYAPPGATSLLPMTVAVNLRGTLVEEEIERKPNALSWGGHSYSLIRKKGTITLTSYRDADSDMRVTVSLPGKAEAVSGDGTMRVDDFHPADWQDGGFWQNNHSDLVWELVLKPGQTVEMTYTVSFYVP